MIAPVDFAPNQASSFKDNQMFWDCVQRDWKVPCDVGDPGRIRFQSLQDRSPGRIR